MKDRQVQAPPPQPRVWGLSTVLHCICMTVVVFLRSSFGYVYLRPKSFFPACCWAFILFTIYAWTEKSAWKSFGPLCIYGTAATALYLLHLAIAFLRENYRTGAHDHDSGTSHLLRFFRQRNSALEWNIHIWAEPLLLVAIGTALRFSIREQYLSRWLFIVTPCYAFKEYLNFWFDLRQRKRMRNQSEDAEEIFDDVPSSAPLEAPKAARKPKIKRERNVSSAQSSGITEDRACEILRLLPGHTLEQAEQNFRTLIKATHPDPNASTPENTSKTAELNDAINLIRKRFSN